jgi:cytoskeletal protein RodZ
MSTEPPRRRHSPAVYRRRRIVLIVALLALVALIWLLIAQPWSGSAAQSTADPSPSTSKASFSEIPVPGTTAPAEGEGTDAVVDPTSDTPASPSAAPSTAPSGAATDTAKPCVAKNVSVEPLADAETYGSGQNPQLSISLTNNGDEDCTINVGTSTQVFTIKSGDDTWWRSTDCQTEPSDMVVTLAAGQSVASAAPLAWDRTRSSVDSCADTGRQVAPGGGASYHVSVEIGGIRSTQSTQLLLY